MELSQLKAILALREFGGITKAAEHLHLSPPAVFSQIRHLEENLGAKLYQRAGRNLSLTAAGRRLADHAKRIVEAHDAAVVDMQSVGRRVPRRLKIGCCPQYGLILMPHFVETFLRVRPEVEVTLSTADEHSLLRATKTGELDAAFVSLPAGEAGLTEHPLWSYELVIVLPADQGESRWRLKRPADLAQAPFIRCRGSATIEAAIQRFTECAGYTPRTVMEHDDLDAIRQCVKRGIGYSIVPYPCVADEAEARGLRVLRPDSPYTHHFGLVHRRTPDRPRLVESLVETAAKWREWWPLARYVEPVDDPSLWPLSSWPPDGFPRLRSA